MRKLTVLSLVVALMLPIGAVAQEGDEPVPPLSDVWIVVPKAGMTQQFEAAVATHMAFRDDNGDSRTWATFTPVIGKNLTAYQFRACCFNWADQDAYDAEDADKGFTQNWGENVDQYVDHYHHYLNATDWENSHWPEEGSDGPLYGVTTWVMKTGPQSASDDAREKMSKLAKDGGWGEKNGPWLWLNQIGGEDVLALVSSNSSYADMAPPEQSFYDFAVKELGSEKKADAMFAAFSSGFASSDYSVWAYREDLSSASDDE